MPTAKKTVKPTSAKTTAAKKSAKIPAKAIDKKPVNNGGFAIIETGGKQYRVAVGDLIKIEKIKKTDSAKSSVEPKEGSAITFDKVLLVDNGKDTTDVGTPYIAGAKVSGTLLESGRSKKVMVVKYKAKSRYLKRAGHRQPYFKIKIEKIS